jgi:hypothetical protein
MRKYIWWCVERTISISTLPACCMNIWVDGGFYSRRRPPAHSFVKFDCMFMSVSCSRRWVFLAFVVALVFLPISIKCSDNNLLYLILVLHFLFFFCSYQSYFTKSSFEVSSFKVKLYQTTFVWQYLQICAKFTYFLCKKITDLLARKCIV